MMKKYMFWLLIGAIVVIGSIGYLYYWNTDSSGSETKEIKIGVIGWFAGKDSDSGESALQGIELARQKIERENILPDKKITLLYQSASSDKPQDGISAFRQLVDVEKVDAVIGPMGSNVVLSVVPIVDETKTPTIVFAASAIQATENNEYVFRLWPTAESYADTIAQKIQKDGVKQLAIITDRGNNNLVDLRDLLLKRLDDTEIVFDEMVVSDTNDFRTYFAKLKQIEADAVFLNLFGEEIGVSARQARELGIVAPFYTNSTISIFLRDLEHYADVVEGMQFAIFSGYEESIGNEFKEVLGSEPQHSDYSAATYDALHILVEAIQAVGTDGEKIKDYLYKNSFEGSIGAFSFKESGDALVPLSVQSVHDGKIITLE